VLCRWGYMLMADPAAALGETRRVLAPGGRVALAVWDSIASNPWALLPGQELIERGLAPAGGLGSDPCAERQPGPFALSDADAVVELLAQAGFTEIDVQTLELPRRHPGFEDLWETTLDLSRGFHDAVLSRPAAEMHEIKASLAQRFAPYTAADGTLTVPARTLVASASA
jgi:SAM-dependent methyltransferase